MMITGHVKKKNGFWEFVLLFNVSIINGHEEELIKLGLNYADIEGLTYESLFKDLDPNWDNEIVVLAKTLRSAVEVANALDLINDYENIDLERFVQKNDKGEYILEKILNEVSNSEIFKNVIINYIEGMEFEGTVKENITLFNEVDENQLKKGDNIIFTAFGAGFTYGAVYVKWGYDGSKRK